jgi:hypothetical protein
MEELRILSNKANEEAIDRALANVRVSEDMLKELILNSTNPTHALEMVLGVDKAPKLPEQTKLGVFKKYNHWNEGNPVVYSKEVVMFKGYTREPWGHDNDPEDYTLQESSDYPYPYLFTAWEERVTSVGDWKRRENQGNYERLDKLPDAYQRD